MYCVLCFFGARQEIGVMVQFHDLYRFAVVFYSVCFVTILTALEHLGLDILVINCVYDYTQKKNEVIISTLEDTKRPLDCFENFLWKKPL